MKATEVLFLYCTLCAFLCLYCSIPLLSNNDIRTEPKHIVFLSKLLLLFQFCHFCHTGNKPDVTATQSGTAVTIRSTCSNPGCRKEFTWTSQPLMPGTKLPAGNFLICMATLFAGGSFTKMKTIFQHMGLACVSYFLQAPTGNLFSCTKCYSISICKFAVGYATSIYFLEVAFFFQFWFYIYTEMDFFFIFPTFPIIQYHYRYLSKPVFNSNFRLGCSPPYISFGSATKQTCSLSSRFWGILQ